LEGAKRRTTDGRHKTATNARYAPATLVCIFSAGSLQQAHGLHVAGRLTSVRRGREIGSSHFLGGMSYVGPESKYLALAAIRVSAEIRHTEAKAEQREGA
jgi:hypothetical protein